jgi:glycosyltransferase involved in cell wall biosynthesis
MLDGMPDVILPVLDEAAALPWVLGRIPAGYRPVVVDNGSTDGSAEIAGALGATVVREPRRGFGAACFAGLRAARADVVCFADCDGSLDPAELPAVAGPVLRGEADLVLGRRRPEPGAWPAHARVLNRALMAECGAGPACASRTLGRCAPRAASRSWPSASPTGASRGRSRWCCARTRRGGDSPRCRSPTGRAPVDRR